jgi:hypothetical protein
MSQRAHLQGKGQRTAGDIYRALEGKTVEEVMQILGVTRYTVTRAARTYGVRFAGIDVRKCKAPILAEPARPNTRCVYVACKYNPSGDARIRITLPKEPWHG